MLPVDLLVLNIGKSYVLRPLLFPSRGTGSSNVAFLGKVMSCGENIMQDLSSRSLQNSVRHLAKSLEEALNTSLPKGYPPLRVAHNISLSLGSARHRHLLALVIVMIVVIILFII